jgi:hypothetical protein
MKKSVLMFLWICLTVTFAWGQTWTNPLSLNGEWGGNNGWGGRRMYGIGDYGLRYAEFVVPLVKAVQELSTQVDELGAQNEQLQTQINKLQEKDALRSEASGESITGLQNAASSGAYLQQNAPNPLSQSTQIKYYLPATVKTANLCIYDLQGAQLKQITIQERGEGTQILSGSELKAGMYLYTLIADGQESDTKRMILTK